MLARENIKLPHKQQLAAPRTRLVTIHGDEPRLEFLDILLDLIGTVCCILHVLS
jgi:hypothetical protein